MTDVRTLPLIATDKLPMAFAYVWLPGVNGGPETQWKVAAPTLVSGGGLSAISFPVAEDGTQESATVARLNFTGSVDVTVAGDEATVNITGGGATQEWAPNFTTAGEVSIPAREAMTIGQGNAKIGAGALTYEKSTAAAPGTFASTTLPAALEAGAWLKVISDGECATHLVRIA